MRDKQKIGKGCWVLGWGAEGAGGGRPGRTEGWRPNLTEDLLRNAFPANGSKLMEET